MALYGTVVLSLTILSMLQGVEIHRHTVQCIVRFMSPSFYNLRGDQRRRNGLIME